MKNFIFVILCTLLLNVSAYSQDAVNQQLNYSNEPIWIEMMQDPEANFHETVDAFNTYWEGREITRSSGYKPFKRWENHWRTRLNADGTRKIENEVYQAYYNFLSSSSTRENEFQGAWDNLGPIEKPGNAGTGQPNGNGRVNAIAFHPTNSDIVYIGAPAGGFWITEDGGQSWISHTDDLPTLGVSAIVVDYVDPLIIYMGTGDRDASDAPGMGVFKSTDGGITWIQWNNGMANPTVGSMLIHPTNNNILFAGTSSGVYKTIDAGENWYKVLNGNTKDLEFKSDDPNIIFATGGGKFYRSTDLGEVFDQITSGIGSASRGVIGTSIANPDVVYFHTVSGSEFAGTYRSEDAGLTFTLKSTSPNIMSWGCNGGSGGQGWYDLAFAVDPTNEDIIYSGGVNTWKSTNGGSNWNINSHWTGDCGVPAVHADCHVLEFSPVDGRLYNGNDGGFYYTENGGNTWPEITSGLAISQIYKISQARGNKDKVMNGYQDNGSATYLGADDAFLTVMGGDGMDCAYDHQDDRYAYGEYYNGQGISRIFNNQNQGGISGGISESGDWVTPFVLDVTKPATMYVGMQSLWRSSNIKANNVNWTNIANLGGGDCNALEQSEVNNDIFYVSKYSGTFYRTDNLSDDNPSFNNLSDFVPSSGNATDVETSPIDENTVYITINSKVFKSTDKGLSWEDITLNLPNANTTSIECYKSDNEGLFVGTDAGIYYKNANMTEWILYSDGFPISANVSDIEVFYDEESSEFDAVRTSTYGRGLWSSPGFYSDPTADFEASEMNIPMGCLVDFYDKSSGVPHQYIWTFEGGTPETSTDRNPMGIQYLEEGNFQVSLTVTNPAGENSKTVSSFINVNSATLPEVDFFTTDTAQCSSQSALFIDNSLGCPTAWDWSFEPNTVNFVNGTNANSQNPEVVFDEPNIYDVTLTVTNSAGDSELTKYDYVFVGGETIPFIENFDQPTLAANGWSVTNPDGRKTWEIDNVQGVSGESNAAKMNFFNYTDFGARDYLNSPILSFIGYEQVLMTFDYAYAQRYNQVDSLIVNISNDCGETWNRLYANGPDGEGIFETSESTAASFAPMSVADWSGHGYGASKPIIDLSQWAGQGDIIIQFESYNKYGNNLFIDNIEISNTAGIENNDINNTFSIYPNPTNASVNILINKDAGITNMQIVDIQGKIIMEDKLIEGNNNLNTSHLKKGIYFVNIKGINSNKTSKLIIQ